MKPISRHEIEHNCFLFALSGSHAYGLNTENSDYDYKGITVAPKRFFTGFHRFEQKDKGWHLEPGLFEQNDSPNVDSVIYDVRRFLELAASQNPNILEMLWQKESDYLHLDNIGRYLLEYRTRFLTKKLSKSFSGYARAQIKKMETHRKWLLQVEPTRPDPANYGIQHDQFPLSKDDVQRFLEFLYTLVRDRIGYFEESRELYSLLQEIDYKQVLKQYPLPTDGATTEMVQELTRANSDFISLLHATQRYHNDLKHYESYHNWKATRNEKRSAIEAKCGYDGKNASHCLRLLFMGYEALSTGRIIVNRHDAGDDDFLRMVKAGEVDYTTVDKLCDEWFNKVEQAYETTSLPATVDDDLLNDICMTIVDRSGVLYE